MRACVALLALVIVAQISITVAGSVGCFYLYLTKQAEIGACSGFLSQSREIWAEALAIVLALLMAARGEPPPDPPEPPPKSTDGGTGTGGEL
jgi:hypothetical protein